MRNFASCVLILALCAVPVSSALAQPLWDGTIGVEGSGMVEVPNDRFGLTVTVASRSESRVGALQGVNGEASKLRELISRVGGLSGLDIQMAPPDVLPACDPQFRDRCQVIGHEASIRFSVTGGPAQQAANLLVVLEDNGFRVSDLAYKLANPTPHVREARRQAFAAARANALDLAAASACQLGQIQSISLGSRSIDYPSVAPALALVDVGSGSATPSFSLDLDPGTTPISETVSVSYQLDCNRAAPPR